MIYIEIPPLMKFKAGNLLDRTEDRFVCLLNERPTISIQQAVHAFYHAQEFYSKHAKGEVQHLILYKKKPITSAPLLEYRANDNGRRPAEYVKELSMEMLSVSPPNPISYVGTRWINHTLLSPERRVEALKKEEDQRLNRQKLGNSPNAN